MLGKKPQLCTEKTDNCASAEQTPVSREGTYLETGFLLRPGFGLHWGSWGYGPLDGSVTPGVPQAIAGPQLSGRRAWLVREHAESKGPEPTGVCMEGAGAQAG